MASGKQVRKSSVKKAKKTAESSVRDKSGKSVRPSKGKKPRISDKPAAVKRVKKPLPGKKAEMPDQKKVRDIMWEIGNTPPSLPGADIMALLMVNPHSGHVYWNISEESLDALRKGLGGKSAHASLIVRVYDVTDIEFDGLNAHSFFDIDAGRPSGNHYFRINRTGRNFLAEAGFRCADGSFHYIARSGTQYFDRDRPAGNYNTGGLYVSGDQGKIFPVENVFNARVYEMMHRETAGVRRKGPLSVAEVLLDIRQEGRDNPLEFFIRNLSEKITKLGVNARVISEHIIPETGKMTDAFMETVNTSSQTLFRQLSALHRVSPFDVVHCHDWYSSKAGLTASRKLNVPMVLTLHSTEHGRCEGKIASTGISAKICEMEKAAVQGASLIIVPDESTRSQVTALYGAGADTVVIIPPVFKEKPADVSPDTSDVKRWFGLNPDAPIVLFSGEISHAAGADIMMDALPTVCRNHRRAQFVFAGEGPLKDELRARADHAGIGHNCRFVGDVSSASFQSLLMASDFVVIPARTWQDEGLARMATTNGKPVLTTQQAGITCVKHGENGLVTFDNPGSIVWGIQEMLSNPLHASMLKIVARKSAGESLSFETSAARHYMYYEIVLKDKKGSNNA